MQTIFSFSSLLTKTFHISIEFNPFDESVNDSGYMAPEYALHGLFSIKSDIYSYGVLVLEILTGQKNGANLGSTNYLDLVSHVSSN